MRIGKKCWLTDGMYTTVCKMWDVYVWMQYSFRMLRRLRYEPNKLFLHEKKLSGMKNTGSLVSWRILLCHFPKNHWSYRVAFTKAFKHTYYIIYQYHRNEGQTKERQTDRICVSSEEVEADGRWPTQTADSSGQRRATSNKFRTHSSRQGTTRLSAKLASVLAIVLYDFLFKIWLLVTGLLSLACINICYQEIDM